MTIWESVFVELDERIAETEQLVTALMHVGEDAREARQRLLKHLDVLRVLHRRRDLLVQLLQEAVDPAREPSPEACQP